MKVLFIGGTGNISAAVSRLAVERGVDLHLLNRGTREIGIPGAKSIVGDIRKEDQVATALGGRTFDVVVNWINFTVNDIERDLRLFSGRCGQYIFISSASVYQKPLRHYLVTESTPLCNPYWPYSQQKIACELRLNEACREDGFPATIVRPSLTYDTVIPLSIASWDDYTLPDRMKRGRKVIVQGDGTSLWTCTHSEDFAKGFVGLLGHPQAIGESFHITSDEVLTWDQIYQAVASALGVEARIVHIPSDFLARFDEFHRGNLLGDKAVSAVFDNSKIKRFVPGFRATIPFAEGIERTLRWMEADPKRMRINESANAFLDKVLAEYGKVFPPALEE